MPERQTLARAQADKRQGKAASTQAGELVKEEMDHIREGIHGARSTKQAIAIGLSKARRAGVDLPAPKSTRTSAQTRKRAARDTARARKPGPKSTSSARSRATLNALRKEGREAASPASLARHAHAASSARSRPLETAANRNHWTFIRDLIAVYRRIRATADFIVDRVDARRFDGDQHLRGIGLRWFDLLKLKHFRTGEAVNAHFSDFHLRFRSFKQFFETDG
jgi:hypothetical protein